jgi:hypothetical protein
MQNRQDKTYSPDLATTKNAESTPKATSNKAAPTRMPAWTSAWGDHPPLGLIAPRADLETKHIASQPGDPSEKEAEQVSDQMMRMPVPGSSSIAVSHVPLMIQRAPAEEEVPSTPAMPESAPEEAQTSGAGPTRPASSGLVVEDEATNLGPGQMKKSEFLTQVEDAASSVAGDNSSLIDNWFAYYSNRSSQSIERAIHTYIPETASVTSAMDYIPLISERVRQATLSGSSSGGTPDAPTVPTSTSPDVSASASTGSTETASDEASNAMLKGREGSTGTASAPHIIQGQLGVGRSLEGNVRSRMESAFGMDFSHVRAHTDARAEGLSNSLNARAFTVGEHIAFSDGEYQPGSLIGDALIAHELAHVVQQRGATQSPSVQQSGTSYNNLEEDADMSAMGAVVSLWGGAKGMLGNITQNALPNLRSGLRLQRCNGNKKPAPPVVAKIDDPKKYPTFEGWLRSFPAYSGSGISDNKDITNITPPDLQKLIAPSLGLPPDCADVSILLRHFYLKAWNQTFSFQAGPGKGKTFKIGAGVSDDEVRKALIDLGSINFQEDRPGTRGKAFDLVDFYMLRGVKIKNLKQLIDAGLKSGDIFVWNRLSTVTGNFEGHVQTVQDIDKAGKKITVVQGNMSAGQGVGELQQRQFTFQELTGNPDGDANIQPRPPASPEEEFFGGGPWR